MVSKMDAPPQYHPDPQQVHRVGTRKIAWMLWDSIWSDLATLFSTITSGVIRVPTEAVDMWHKSAWTSWQSLYFLLRVAVLAIWMLFNITFMFKLGYSSSGMQYSEKSHPPMIAMLLQVGGTIAWSLYNTSVGVLLLFPDDFFDTWPGVCVINALIGQTILFWTVMLVKVQPYL
ncbi:hypothetical protein PENSPDRAFT_375397 [Peniophora sp. CONT]|nr:hypothetical protein PENSPDRAFT_375397 [Peniophora sp. CONT]